MLARVATASALIGLALCGLPASAVEPSGRIAIRDGGFVDEATGLPFVPLGVNYYRVGEPDPGKQVHATFCPGLYDRAFVEEMMTSVSAAGFNTVRTFHSYHVGEHGILTSPQSREIAPGYLDNVIHFLSEARDRGIHVIFSWDIWLPDSQWWAERPMPGEETYDLRAEWDPALGINGLRLTRGSVRTRANGIVCLIEALRARDPGLLPVVLAWELENEVYLSAKAAPFAERTGRFAFAGHEYDLASDAEAQTLMDAVLTQWANACADAIHQADPAALVSTGLFTFAAVGRGGPGTLSRDETQDERIPGRPLALLDSRLDYVDMHLYAWRTADAGVTEWLERNLRSVEWGAVTARARVLGKPLVCGECGLFANYLRSAPDWQKIDHELGEQCFREHVAGLRAHGLAGALYWSYGSPDSTAGDECPALTFHPRYGGILADVFGSRM